MSFPPRHPMMRGMMMPQFGPYPPMGMMQMGMMPMPNMMPPIIRNPIIQKEPVINQAALNSIHEEKLPVTTVFVGNIHEKAPDIMIKCMLGKCGSVTNWKRVQGTTGKLQAFGFCEYDNPESTLRCIRTLNDLQILDKKLLVKVDANTNTLLEEYKSKRSDKTSSSREEKEKDAEVLKEIQAVLKEYEGELNRIIFETSTISTSTTTSTSTSTTSKTKLSVVEETDKKLQSLKTKQKHNIESGKFAGDEMDDEIQSLVSKEIRSFRDAHLNSEKEESREKSSKSDRARSRREERERDRLREREREREKNREREREREKEREREREKEREREAERERERQERRHSRSKTRDLSPREEAKRLNDDEDNEEVYERKKLERRLRDKEAAYQELLRKWESRERKKIREHDKEKQREKERRVEENKESKRLREFLEDYNDERDDVKYYKGSALQQRLFERQKEMDSDDRDRQREVEEVEDIRRKLQEEGRDDVEEEIARIEREREQHLLPGIPMAVPTHTSPQASYSPGVIVLDKTYSPTNNHQDTIIRAEVEDEDVVMISENGPDKNNTFSELDKYQDPPQTSAPISTEGLSSLSNYTSDTSDNEEMMNNEDSNPPHPSPSQTNDSTYSNEDSTKKNKRKLTVHEAFKPEEEVEKSHKKQKLIPLNEESNSSDGKGLSAEEKRKWIKSFIDQIPVEKDNLFAWEVDWSLVDNSLIEKRIKPWVNKKIVEYIGEDEPALSDFICKKVLSHTPPDTILSDISLVLDDEAEVFVMKMWRLLVYEIEAKKCGVIK